MSMGGGGGGERVVTNTQQTTEPWAAQKPYLETGFERAQSDILDVPQQYYPDSTVVPFSPETETALGLTTNRALAGSPVNLAAQQSMTDTLGGGYLNQGNPAFQGMVERSVRPLRDEYLNTVVPGISSQFIGANRTGSNAMQTVQGQAADDYMRAVGDVTSSLAFPTYEAERTNMMRGAALAPQLAQQDYMDLGQLGNVGAARESLGRQQIAEDVNRWNFEQNEARNRLAQYMNLVQGNYGGTAAGAQTANPYQQGGSPILGGLGGALAGASAGSMFGPWGAGIGALGGLGLGLFA